MNIFDIGGNSIAIVKILSNLVCQGYNIAIKDLLGSKVLKNILILMKSSSQSSIQPLQNEYEICQLQKNADIRDILHCITTNFTEKNEIYKEAGVQYHMFYELLDTIWNHCDAYCDLSYAIRDKTTGSLLAASIFTTGPFNEDYTAHILLKFPQLKTAVALREALDNDIKSKIQLLPGKTAYNHCMGIDPSLDSEATMRMVTILTDLDKKRAQERGYSRVYAAAVHPVSKVSHRYHFLLIIQRT